MALREDLRTTSMKKVEAENVCNSFYFIIILFYVLFIFYMGVWLWVFGLHVYTSTMCIPGA